MTMPGRNQQPASFGQMMDFFTHLPSPEALFKELKRLNDNLERIQPDVSKMANSLNTLNLQEVRNLTITLQGMKLSEMTLVAHQLNSTMTNLYEKLWGKK